MGDVERNFVFGEQINGLTKMGDSTTGGVGSIGPAEVSGL